MTNEEAVQEARRRWGFAANAWRSNFFPEYFLVSWSSRPEDAQHGDSYEDAFERADDRMCSECSQSLVNGQCESDVCFCPECGARKEHYDFEGRKLRGLPSAGPCEKCLEIAELDEVFNDDADLKVGRSL